MGVLDKVVSLQDEHPFVKMVLHGAEGVGKTYFSGSAPNPVWCDFERSSETLRYVESLKNTKVLRPKNFGEVRAFAREAAKQYETLVFDTVTSMQVFYMREYMVEVESKSKGRDKFLPYQGDYRYATNELTDFFLELQEAPVNVIFIAHSKFIENEEGRLVQIRPAMTPAVWDALKAFINVVAYLEKKINIKGEAERSLYLNSTNVISAKNRLGIETLSIKNPNFQEIFNTKD